MYDAMTGNYILSIVNGTNFSKLTLDDHGGLIGYYTNSSRGQTSLTVWNSTRTILRGENGNSDLGNAWQWRPTQDGVYSFANGIEWSAPIATEINGESISLSLTGISDDVVLMSQQSGGSGSFNLGWTIVAGYSAVDGHQLWGPANHTEVIDSRLLFAAETMGSGTWIQLDSSTLTASGYSLSTGNKIWGPKALPNANPFSSLGMRYCPANGTLYVWTYGGDAYAIDMKTGNSNTVDVMSSSSFVVLLRRCEQRTEHAAETRSSTTGARTSSPTSACTRSRRSWGTSSTTARPPPAMTYRNNLDPAGVTIDGSPRLAPLPRARSPGSRSRAPRARSSTPTPLVAGCPRRPRRLRGPYLDDTTPSDTQCTGHTFAYGSSGPYIASPFRARPRAAQAGWSRRARCTSSRRGAPRPARRPTRPTPPRRCSSARRPGRPDRTVRRATPGGRGPGFRGATVPRWCCRPRPECDGECRVVTLAIIAVNIFVYLAVQPHGTAQQTDTFLGAGDPLRDRPRPPLTQPQIALDPVLGTRPRGGRERHAGSGAGAGGTVRADQERRSILVMFLRQEPRPPVRQHAVPLDLRQQHRGHFGRLGSRPSISPRGSWPDHRVSVVNAGSVAPVMGGPLRHDRGCDGRLPDLVPPRPHHERVPPLFFLPFYLPAALMLLLAGGGHGGGPVQLKEFSFVLLT